MSYINNVSMVEKIKGLVRESLDFNNELKGEAIIEVITELVFDQSAKSYINTNEKKEIIEIVFNSQVDYVSRNNAIGKVHAEIIIRENMHFIIDLNSRNGTYINGERIISNVEYAIKNNDTVAFANSEYKFVWADAASQLQGKGLQISDSIYN